MQHHTISAWGQGDKGTRGRRGQGNRVGYLATALHPGLNAPSNLPRNNFIKKKIAMAIFLGG